MYGLIADALVGLHLAFVVFVAIGGVLVLRWPKVAWVHVPAAAYGAAIEFAGWICPLTPLENRYRVLAGEAGYEGDFVARYLMPVVYPEGLTREVQIALGLLVVVFNLLVYGLVYVRRRGRIP